MVAVVVLLLGYQPDAAHMLRRLCFLSNLDLGLCGLFWDGWRPGSPWQRLGKWRSQVGAARLGQRELLPARFQETGTETHSYLGKPERRSKFPLCRFQSALFFQTLELWFWCDRKRAACSLPLYSSETPSQHTEA